MPGFHPDPATPRSSRFNMKSDLASARRSAESGRNLFSDLLKFSFRFYQQSFQTKTAPGNWVTGSLTLVSRWNGKQQMRLLPVTCQLLHVTMGRSGLGRGRDEGERIRIQDEETGFQFLLQALLCVCRARPEIFINRPCFHDTYSP